MGAILTVAAVLAGLWAFGRFCKWLIDYGRHLERKRPVYERTERREKGL